MPRPPDPVERIRARVANSQSEAVAAALPRGYFRLGDVLIVDLPLPGDERATAQAYAESLAMRSVLGREDGIRGELREPTMRLLWGDANTETLHRESGFDFRLDPARVMWSPGNLAERQRAAAWRCEGETIVDFFAGVGYFAIPLAVRSGASRVIAIEKNPVSHAYLLENAKRNGAAALEARLGDCRDMAPKGEADRVLLGLLPDSLAFVPRAVEALRPEGGWMHVHRNVQLSRGVPAAQREVELAIRSTGRTARVHHVERVKSYAPSAEHIVFDVEVRP